MTRMIRLAVALAIPCTLLGAIRAEGFATVDWRPAPREQFLAPDFQSMTAVVQLGSGRLVAVGNDDATPLSGSGAVWTSDDGGTAWARRDAGPGTQLDSDGQEFLGDVVLSTGVLVAVGGDRVGPSASEDAAVWTSADGTAWVRQAGGVGGTFDVPGRQTAAGTTATPAGTVVMVGNEDLDGTNSNDPAVWTSSNGGVDWTRRLDADFAVPAPAGFIDVAAAPNGTVVAVGSAQPAASLDGYVAVSTDNGATWTVVAEPTFATPASETFSGVTWTGSEFVAYGGQDVAQASQPYVYSSPDGTVWTPLTFAEEAYSQSVQAVAATPSGTYVAAGQEYTDDTYSTWQIAVWTSEDGGTTWVRSPDADLNIGQPNVTDAVATSTGYIMVGSAWDGVSPYVDAAAWTGALYSSGGPGGGGAGGADRACPTTGTVPFVDVAASFAANQIRCIFSLGITSGVDATHYNPSGYVTREQMAVFLDTLYTAYLLHQAPEPASAVTFTDIAGSFAEGAIGRIFGLGVTSGVDATHYAPSSFVTRGQMAVFLANLYADLLAQEPQSAATPFVDTSGHFAADAIAAIYGLGITTGVDGTHFDPNGLVTREQMAVFLANLYLQR